MRAYRVESLEHFAKLYAWLDKGDFDDLSRRCGARVWNRRFVGQMLGQKNYKAHEFSIFALEDDKGEIQAVITAEARFPERDKIPCKMATNFNLIFKRGAGKTEHDELLKYVFKWGYEHGFEKADVWSLDVYANWLKEFCGKYSEIVAEMDIEGIGHVVRQIVDIKGWVENCLRSQ